MGDIALITGLPVEYCINYVKPRGLSSSGLSVEGCS